MELSERRNDDIRNGFSFIFPTPVKPPSILEFRDGGETVPIFTEGNLSAIKGAAKSRKTFFLTLLTGIIGNEVTENYYFKSSLVIG